MPEPAHGIGFALNLGRGNARALGSVQPQPVLDLAQPVLDQLQSVAPGSGL